MRETVLTLGNANQIGSLQLAFSLFSKKLQPISLVLFIALYFLREGRKSPSSPGSSGSSPVVPRLRPDQGRAARVGAGGGRTGPVPGAPANARSEEELCHPAGERVQRFRVHLTAGRTGLGAYKGRPQPAADPSPAPPQSGVGSPPAAPRPSPTPSRL